MATVGGEDKREKAYNKKIAGIRARAQQSAQQAKNPQPEPDSGPADDVKDIVAPDEQYRFSHPDYPGEGINIIVRNTGWYLDKLPQALRGRVKRDSATRLYPVLQPNNIKKYNLYYNQAADANRVRHEPAHSL
jgi:hypothetical protein